MSFPSLCAAAALHRSARYAGQKLAESAIANSHVAWKREGEKGDKRDAGNGEVCEARRRETGDGNGVHVWLFSTRNQKMLLLRGELSVKSGCRVISSVLSAFA